MAVDYGSGVTAEEYLLHHQQLREEFMTEDDIAEAELYLDWFRESYRAMDNAGLFDKWDEIDDAWAGNINEPVYPSDPGSETNIINPHVEGQVAISWQDPVGVSVKAVEPSDTFYQRDAQAILDFVVKSNKIQSKRDNIYRRMKKYGTAFVTAFWDKKKLDRKGMPVIRSWDPRYVILDPTILDPQDFQDSRYVILAASKSINWALQNYGEKAHAITPGYHPIQEQWDIGYSKDWSDYERENSSYIHLYILTKRNSDGEKVRLIQMSGDGVVLEETTLIDDTYPLFFREQMHDENNLYGRSTTEMLLPVQDLINDLDDQIRINARLFGNVQKVVNSNSGIDLDSWTNEPGLNISTNAENPEQAYSIVKPQGVSQDVFVRRGQAFGTERHVIGRFGDHMTGIQQQGVDTATEAAQLAQTGSAIIDVDRRKIQDMFGEILTYCLKLCEHYWTTEMAFRITGDEDFYFMRPSKLKEIPLVAPASQEYIEKARKEALKTFRMQLPMLHLADPGIPSTVPDDFVPPGFVPPKYMTYKDKSGKVIHRQAMFDIDVDFGADVPTNKAYMLNALKEAMLAQVIDPMEYRQVLHDYKILPYMSAEKEQEINEKIREMRDAVLFEKKAAAQSVLMNAQANNGMGQPGMPPPAQGQIGGTPTSANPLESAPSPVVRGMNGVNRVANMATQPGLAANPGV